MSSRLLKKYEKIPGGLRIEITGIQYYCSTALESAVRTADTSAMEVYWDPDGYSSPQDSGFPGFVPAMEPMEGCIRGYIVSTESLKGTERYGADPCTVHCDLHHWRSRCPKRNGGLE